MGTRKGETKKDIETGRRKGETVANEKIAIRLTHSENQIVHKAAELTDMNRAALSRGLILNGCEEIIASEK